MTNTFVLRASSQLRSGSCPEGHQLRVRKVAAVERRLYEHKLDFGVHENVLSTAILEL